MENQGTVLLGTVACVAVGLVIMAWGANAFLKTESRAQRRQRLAKPFPTGPRPVGPMDHLVYLKINTLVAFFVNKMREVGFPELSRQRMRAFEPGDVMRKLLPANTTLPIEITVARKAWWGGPQGKCCITSDGQWEYMGVCESHRERSWGEFAAWWVVSSHHFKQSVAKRDPYPFNMYLVLNEGTATLQHALSAMAAMMEALLAKHNPGAVAEFRALRDRR